MGSRPSRRWLTLRRWDDRARERTGAELLCGADEAGRGPLAGPVVAAAVLLPRGVRLPGIDDSKALEPGAREDLARTVRENAISVAWSVVGPRTIDRLNILRASLLALRRAVLRASVRARPDWILIDGNQPVPDLEWPQETVVEGDGRSLAVAAASVVAKTLRDGFMRRLDLAYPGYGFARHKGYSTLEHQQALARLGPCPWHRYSFAPVRQPSLFSGAIVTASKEVDSPPL